MTTEYLSPSPMQQYTDASGNFLAGGKLFTYAASTTTKLATYTDSTGSTPNTNPIILNPNGTAGVWIPPGTVYKFVLAPANDTDPPTAPIWTVDQVSVPNILPNTNAGVELYFLQVNSSGTGYQLISPAGVLAAIGAAPATGSGVYAPLSAYSGNISTNTTLTSATSGNTYTVGYGASAPFTVSLPAAASNLRYRFVGNSTSTSNYALLTTASGALYTPDGVYQSLPWQGNMQLVGTCIEAFSDGSSWYLTNYSGQNTVRPAVNPSQAPQWQQVLGGAASPGTPATIHNVTGSRAFGTTYTNNYNKPMPVWVVGTTNAGFGSIQGIVNGAAIDWSEAPSDAGHIVNVFLIVPSGATYSVSATTTGLTSWNEYY